MTKPPCKRCQEGIDHDFVHNESAWVFHGCRCDVCGEDRRRNRRESYSAHREDRCLEARQRNHSDAGKAYESRRIRPPGYVEWKRQQQKAYRETNRSYLSRKGQAWAKGRGLPLNATQLWTPEQDAVVISADITLTEMAYLTGRTYQAVATRRALLKRSASA